MSPKLRFRRGLKEQRRQVENFGVHAEQELEQHFFKRLNKFNRVWRFMLAWTTLFVLLIGLAGWQLYALNNQYQTLKPVPGGIYVEGVHGSFTNTNPIFATNEVDTTVSRLIFSGLLKYNDKNQLTGDLAQSWTANKLGDTYTVHLKPNLVWQDGQPLTSSDVAFTYQLIQNPDTESPLIDSWQGVSVSAPDPTTVVFKLPDPLSSFPYNLTTGILPEHLLKNIPPANLRSASFNTGQPVGAGPFEWQTVQVSGTTPENAEEQIALNPFERYNGGVPKLDSFTVHAFADQKALIRSFQSGQLTAVAGLDSVPPSLAHKPAVKVHDIIMTAGTYVFFNNSSSILKDVKVREALVEAADTKTILGALPYRTIPVVEPLLIGQLGYNSAYAQAKYNAVAAGKLLDQDGWKLNSQNVRYKDKAPLKLDIFMNDTSEHHMVAGVLQQDWAQLGVNAQMHFENSDTFQNTLTSKSYDAVLNSISIGGDPDVFVYWDSSQSDPRSSGLNFSQYNNTTADLALESGRTRLDATLRTIKYEPFLKAWQQGAPALGLYQSRYLYITHGTVYGLNSHRINTDAERFDNVENWEVRQARVTD